MNSQLFGIFYHRLLLKVLKIGGKGFVEPDTAFS